MKSNKPNVLVINIDQLRSAALGCYGNTFVQTPHIDKMAEEGVVFQHCVSNNPVCVPARSILLSGQYSRTCAGDLGNQMAEGPFGASNRESKFKDSVLPEILRDNGYDTALIGKWHVDCRPSLLGFDYSLLPDKIFFQGSFRENELDEPINCKGYTSDFELKRMVQYFQEESNKPRFVYYNIVNPHMPVFDIPYKYTFMYDPEKTPLRKNVYKDGKLPFDRWWIQIYLKQEALKGGEGSLVDELPDDFDLSHFTALYCGAVSWTDALVGYLLDFLKQSGVLDNTVVILTADHGDMLGSHHEWNKGQLYSKAVDVPMIVRWPAEAEKGLRNTDSIVSLVDIMPTILDICGIDVPDHVQGHSFRPQLSGKASEHHAEAYIETSFNHIGIKTLHHTYGMAIAPDKKVTDDQLMFFDDQADPFQMENLAGTNSLDQAQKTLKEKLLAWNRNTPSLKDYARGNWIAKAKSRGS